MDKKAMYKLSYGLFVLTAKEGDKDNGCIINTAIQAASTPNQMSICVNKANYTHDMIMRTGLFNVSILRLNLICSKDLAFKAEKTLISLRILTCVNVVKMVCYMLQTERMRIFQLR